MLIKFFINILLFYIIVGNSILGIQVLYIMNQEIKNLFIENC